jgi:dihydrofolate synthase/folylpolyglutamate synthase
MSFEGIVDIIISLKALSNKLIISGLILSFLKDKRFNGPKVVFGSHYIAKYVYKFFDFSFDKGNI